MKITDLKPFPSGREQVRAMKRLGDCHHMTHAEFSDALAREILAERKGRENGKEIQRQT